MHLSVSLFDLDLFVTGVGGLSLGGGYGWRTNQVGLTMDTIVGYELISPTGIPMNVTNVTNPDLFFALKVSCVFLSCYYNV